MWARTRREDDERSEPQAGVSATGEQTSAIYSWETFPLALAPVSSVCIDMHTLDTYSPPPEVCASGLRVESCK